jgi:1,4-alpha-glucan branching enzyme
LGTFDKAIFERFEYFKDLGVNAIELLPIQDSPDTLNWGYGTRFFFAPDLDMGEPFDLKLFIKRCHQNSIRVILDVVMNHSRGCPLEQLAFDWFYLRSGAEEPINSSEERPSWGGQIFRYATRRGGQFQARNFHLDMAQYWIEEYHIDGFRIDEFLGINNWDFIRDFTKHAQSVQQRTFPGRPFIVIAEDSWRRPQSTQPGAANIPVVNAIWDFDFRDELRRLVCNQMYTDLGKPSRTERVKAMLIGNKLWSDWDKNWRNGSFSDLAQRVTYCTSHDIEKDEEQRLYSFFLSKLEHVGHSISDAETHSIAFEQVCSAFALMLTTAGMPMFLAGEEFAELHDTDRRNWRLKMSDPIDWTRSEQPGRRDLIRRIKELVKLRTTHPALQRNEIELFSMNNGFHPSFDTNDGERVFVYCRTSGQALGRPGQVIVVANCGFKRYPVFDITYWPWGNNPALTEYGGRAQPLPAFNGQLAQLELMPFQVRVFSV